MADLATVTVSLKHGILFQGRLLTQVVLREPLLEDLVEAEGEAHSTLTPLAFRRALVARQIVSLDGQALPVTPAMLSQLKTGDWNRLALGLNEAEQLGEAGCSASATT